MQKALENNTITIDESTPHYEWREEDLQTEYHYSSGTIFHGQAAALLDELCIADASIFNICDELLRFAQRKYDGDIAAFIDNVEHCADYSSVAPLLKHCLMNDR